MIEHLAVPRPMDRTVEGPRLQLAAGIAIVEYDWEDDEGERLWVRVTFRDVVSLTFRDSSSYEAESVGPAQEIVVLESSQLLLDVLAQRERLTADRSRSARPRMKHFRMYFDDAGALDVVATSVTTVPV